MFRGNTDDKIVVEGGALVVTGRSDPVQEAQRLLSRHVVVMQEVLGEESELISDAPAGLDLDWVARLPAAGFNTGPATAVATETYFSCDKRPTVVTVTWTNEVSIE